MPDLAINDPVHVTTRENRQLEGVVAFLGPVSFAEGKDWVGVRLTGTSIGLGKNDGSVQGTQYFECPSHCGLFVKKSALSKRQLTRLEELRLRRELAQTSESGGTATTTAAASTAAASSTASSSSSSKPRGRLEEIRQRRAQLQTSASKAQVTAADPAELQSQIEQLQEQLRGKDSNIEALEGQLKEAKEQNESFVSQISDLQEQLENAPKQGSVEKTADEEPSDFPPQPKRLTSRLTSTSGTDANEAQLQIEQLHIDLDKVRNEMEKNKSSHQHELDKERQVTKDLQVELTAAKTECEQLQKELGHLAEQTEVRGASDTSHYKERAKLQAEVASLNRKVEQLELDKQDMENNVEDLALDKEQLLEEKEAIEDRLEEFKLDLETAQMEVEELRMELEDAKAAQESAESKTVPNTPTSAAGGQLNDAQDMAQSLSVQNSRLREALIRLREQSSVEKMELSRQLRSSEKQAEEGKAMIAEVEKLRSLKTEHEEQISDLKDMVEQGSAYEVMVEDLSDRVLSLEEELVALQQTIREMEEAADITAEMEEVQNEEVKALNRDLEDRESVIRNLEEAIKMQRRREEDFQRTVGNYRTMVETLKQEKNALLELQQGGEGEKSDLVSASQKALARAAQLVQDAAEMRKREAQAAIDRIDSQVRMHLSERLESLLPPSIAAAEIASIKGELLLSKVVGKASLSLDGIARSFAKTIRFKAWEWRADKEEEPDLSDPLTLTDEQQQMASTMIHQAEVAHVAIDVSGDLLWLLSAGQWPEILYPEASAELGAIMGHSMSELDLVLGNVLNTLKEEGVLSPHQSNIGAFRQTVVSTMQTLKSHIEQDGESLVPMDWKPPALKLFRDTSRAKYSSLGCYGAVASVLNAIDSYKPGAALRTKQFVAILRNLLQKLDQASSEAAKSCLRLAQLDVQDEETVMDITVLAEQWRAACDDLLGNVYNLLLSDKGIAAANLSSCEAATDEAVKLVSQFAATLRNADLQITHDQKFHPFSPEVADVWEGVTTLARSIRSKDGDEDDINYLLRARSIENSLEEAVEKEPKLALANAKITSLEKSLNLRSKEIAMQNSRLTEMEKLLAKTSAQPSPRIKSSELTSSEEINGLRQEIRVLTEAMDVMHRQVEEYESEIRFLKDAKSPKVRSRTPRRTPFTEHLRERSRSGGSLSDMELDGHVAAFEAALFRPALHAARRDAAQWKARATVAGLLELPPLSVSGISPLHQEEKQADEDFPGPLMELSSALSNYRMETAAVQVVDITKKPSNHGKSSRSSLHQMMMKKVSAADQLDKATASARQWLEAYGSGPPVSVKDFTSTPLVGRVKFGGPNPTRTVRTPTNREDLHRLQLHFAQ